MDGMFVTKRNGIVESVHFDKITERISKLVKDDERKFVDPIMIAQKTVSSIYSGITTEELDLESAKICINLCTTHHLYSLIASRILVSNLHKKTNTTFIEKENYIQKELNLLDDSWLKWINENAESLNQMIDYSRDYLFDYFGFKTLERAYLIKVGTQIIETPQDMFMRVASFINKGDLDAIKKTYDLMSQGFYTHASPTLFNAANKRSQLSSCFEGTTLVNTLRGPIPIKDVELGDEVITHLGNVKKVIQKHKNKINKRKLYEVNIRKTNKFIVTEDHKLFCYNKITQQSNWKEVKILDENDYIMIPKYDGNILKPEINVLEITKTFDFSKYKNEIKVELTKDQKQVYTTTIFKHTNLNNQAEVSCCTKSTPLNAKIEINNDIIKFIGIWFGDGHIMTQTKNNIKIIRGIGITIHDKNIELINFCKEIKKYFGIEHVTIHKMVNQNIIQVLYNCPILGIVFNQLFGKGFNGKKIPEIFYKYNTKLILSFLTGLITTDGCISSTGIITLCMANKNLVNQIYSLCRLHNLDVGQVCRVKPGKLTKTQAYNICLTNLRYDLTDIWKTYKDDRINKLKIKSNIRNQSSPIIDDNKFKYLHFEGRTEIKIDDEYVYTLGVEDDHSYSIEGIIAQNCFLLGTDDSIEGITKTWADVSKISKWGGGIGLHVSNIRAKDSLIRGTNGPSSGIIPMLKVYNEIARYIDQGGKRKGSIAIYLEPHHADIMAFLDLRKNFGAETERARDLFTSMWISDLFMKQVQDDSDWYLMCPDICKGLSDVYGDEYEKLYWKYVNENKYKEKVKARDVMKAILDSQLETGTPYIAFKDSVNKKSNQKNIGTIKSSNLCIEILEYSDDKEYAVCNLASIAVNKFIDPFIFKDDDQWVIYSKDDCKFCNWAKTFLNNKEIKFTEIKNKLPENKNTYPQIYYNDNYIGGYNELFDYIKGSFNYDKLYETAYIATKNLDKIIDINFYPVPEAKLSNLKHRPIGLGIQGLADALVLLKIPFDSDESIEFNKNIMEIIYLAAITASNDLSKDRFKDLTKLFEKLYTPEGDEYYDQINIPEFYDPNFILKNYNEIYHRLKLNGFELNIINNIYKENYIGSYSTFKGSPFSQGQFQFDLWSIDPIYKDKWDILREEVKKYGVRNSLLTALMPTASTSQILGNNECFEFFTNNIYTRRTLAGDFPLVNKYLIDDLYDLNLWSNEMKQMIIANNGSISNFTNIPEKIRRLYQTIWEIKQIWVLKNAVARGPYVDQTQSMNIFLPIPDYQKLYSSHFWAWSNGLKTGIYYLRSKPAKEATKFTIDNDIMNKVKKMAEDNDVCENCSA